MIITKFIANVFLMVLALGVMLGNYWFTFGLWPQSWWAFAGWGVAAIVVMLMRYAIEKEL